MNKILIIILCSFLSACAVHNPYAFRESITLNNKPSGVLLVSAKFKKGIEIPKVYGLISPFQFALGGRRHSFYPSFEVRSINRNIEFLISPFTNTSHFFPIVGPGSGYTDFFQLPPGNYEIFAWYQCFNTDWGRRWSKSKNEFSIPFTIVAGKLNYIGQISIDDFVFSLTDQRERDLKYAYNKFPFLKKTAINYQELECQKGCDFEPVRVNDGPF